MNDIWKDIVGLEGYYEVSNLGNIRSLDRIVSSYNGGRLHKGKNLSQNKTNGNGYIVCRLLGKNNYFHRAVAAAFIPNPSNFPEVNHINGNKSDNRAANLEWCTSKVNQNHALMTGLIPLGSDHFNSKLTETEVTQVFYLANNRIIPQTEIAGLYGICQQTVSDIKLRKSRKKSNLFS